MEDEPAWPSLSHTNVGFLSDRFDWVADPKLFLVSISREIYQKRQSHTSKKLRRIVKNIFYPLKIDWSCGWDDIKDKGASDYVIGYLESYNTISPLFTDYDHYCIDIIQSLIILPLEKHSYTNIGKAYSTFLKEWIKIEENFSSPFYSMYILKIIVDIARDLRPDYMDKNTQQVAVQIFRQNIYEHIEKYAKFCSLKHVNFEILLCSLYVLSKGVEGMLYDIINDRVNRKNKEYSRLPLQSIQQIYATLEVNIPSKYTFTDKTNIMVFDCIRKNTKTYKLPEQSLDEINNLHYLTRGCYIYDMYKTTL
jgi:hypothetical protein